MCPGSCLKFLIGKSSLILSGNSIRIVIGGTVVVLIFLFLIGPVHKMAIGLNFAGFPNTRKRGLVGGGGYSSTSIGIAAFSEERGDLCGLRDWCWFSQSSLRHWF